MDSARASLTLFVGIATQRVFGATGEPQWHCADELVPHVLLPVAFDGGQYIDCRLPTARQRVAKFGNFSTGASGVLTYKRPEGGLFGSTLDFPLVTWDASQTILTESVCVCVRVCVCGTHIVISALTVYLSSLT